MTPQTKQLVYITKMVIASLFRKETLYNFVLESIYSTNKVPKHYQGSILHYLGFEQDGKRCKTY